MNIINGGGCRPHSGGALTLGAALCCAAARAAPLAADSPAPSPPPRPPPPALWFAYGLAIKDYFIGFPNGIGAGLNVICVLLCERARARV
jgi:hypothetical protein